MKKFTKVQIFLPLKLHKSFIKNLIFQFSILITLALSLPGCGRKAPPVPPSRTQPPAVNDLSANIDGDTLKLTWSIPKEKGKIASGLSGFIVYRSKMPHSESDCKNCPVLFEHVSDIPIEVKGSGSLKKDPMTYHETLEKGYKYIYKIIGYHTKGVTGSDSNHVDFIY